MKLLYQDVLASRFGMKFHHEQKEMAVYELTVGKGGPKLTASVAKPTDNGGFMYRRLGDLRVTQPDDEGLLRRGCRARRWIGRWSTIRG